MYKKLGEWLVNKKNEFTQTLQTFENTCGELTNKTKLQEYHTLIITLLLKIEKTNDKLDPIDDLLKELLKQLNSVVILEKQFY